jgi:hypothetical protein
MSPISFLKLNLKPSTFSGQTPGSLQDLGGSATYRKFCKDAVVLLEDVVLSIPRSWACRGVACSLWWSRMLLGACCGTHHCIVEVDWISSRYCVK